MGVKIHIHQTHRHLADGQAVVEVEGDTVGACLEQLVAHYPALDPEIFDAGGGLSTRIDIYHNLESAYPEELKRMVAPGDEIHLTMLLAGG
jgi:molybdopterin converting factor small subunit